MFLGNLVHDLGLRIKPTERLFVIIQTRHNERLVPRKHLCPSFWWSIWDLFFDFVTHAWLGVGLKRELVSFEELGSLIIEGLTLMMALAKDDKRCSSAIVSAAADGPIISIILEAWISKIMSYHWKDDWDQQNSTIYAMDMLRHLLGKPMKISDFYTYASVSWL